MAADGSVRPLGAAGARMLHNLAEALYPELALDPVPAAERRLLHEGVGAVRRARLALLWLEWEPVLTLRGSRFWRLPLAARQAACARWRGSRFAFARRAWARLAAFAEDALAASAPSHGNRAREAHSSDGA